MPNRKKIKDNIYFKIGKSYFFMTDTYHILGKVKEINGQFLILKNASWIASTGRFTQFIDLGIAEEIEPVKSLVYLNIEYIMAAFDWKHKLFFEQK